MTVVLSAAALFGSGAAAGTKLASPDPAPTVTVPGPTVTAPGPTVTKPVPPTPTGTDPATAPPGTATTANGTVLGTYSVNINADHSIPLRATKPTQAEFSTTGQGDLGTGGPGGHLVFLPINGTKMLALPSGTTPTYEACASDTVFSTQADSTAATSFCVLEKGSMAGVTVASVNSTYVVLDVTVWQHVV
ncbi:hypothetical protein ACFQ6N_00085 [Kitasatospora sp. NPDC056446]|uniref:hypothetical protein n=1 Tax=Kitasatospora sp. NPDC056446 TaxID=3345819 RepID=UPI00368C3D02